MRAFLLFLSLLLSGCATKTWKLEGASEVSNDLVIRVKTDQWKYHPPYLNRYVLPLYIEVENHGKEPVRLAKEDVFLMDEKHNQYNPLEPRDVISAVGRGHRIAIDIGFGYMFWGSSVGSWWSPYYNLQREEEGAYSDILNRAFVFGELQSGARLKGFVYFQKVPSDTSLLFLNIKGYKFQLRKR